ncbi:MAG TPA: hypothetical protein VN414_09165, partial [Methanosarcina sp.]|nr:hypothetical protein [Methanosarcina sp.]
LNYSSNAKLECDIDFNLNTKHLGLSFSAEIDISSSKSLTEYKWMQIIYVLFLFCLYVFFP